MVTRQKLMQENYKINKGLADACHQDIKQYRCLEGEGDRGTKQGRMAKVLLCLEREQREGLYVVFMINHGNV